jgi:hypothetical protein
MELRCEHKLHGVIHDGLIEVKCKSALCGSRSGVVIIHRFDPITGVLVDTKQYKDTPVINNRKEQGDALGQQSAVRSA